MLASAQLPVIGVATYLYRSNVCVLCDVLVLIECVLRQLALLLLNRQFNQQEHNRLKRRNGDISGALRRDMLVEKGQGGGGLVDADEFMGALQDILGFLMRWRRLKSSQHRDNINVGSTRMSW